MSEPVVIVYSGPPQFYRFERKVDAALLESPFGTGYSKSWWIDEIPNGAPVRVVKRGKNIRSRLFHADAMRYLDKRFPIKQ
jgi:hypothetical protein